MPGPLILIPCFILGVVIATWGRIRWLGKPDDTWLFFLGMMLGALVAWTTVEPWFALGLVVIVPLIVARRRKATTNRS